MITSFSADQALMRRVQDNEPDAFTLLHQRLAPTAQRVAGALCRDRDTAHDAVQEGFLSIWRSRGSYRPELGAMDTWAYAIVRHRTVDALRRDERHLRRRAGEPHAGDEKGDTTDVLDSVMAGEVAQRLRAGLDGLPAAQREVIELAFFEDLTHSEIAARLDVPLGTIKSRLRLGLAKLRDFAAG